MLEQINGLISYYENNPNVDPNVVEFMDRLIGCVEELKMTEDETARIELKRSIAILARKIVNRCSSKKIITDDAVLVNDASNYSLLFKSDFELDRISSRATNDYCAGKKQDPMFGVISDLVGRIKNDEYISDEELDYARLLMNIYFWSKQEKRDKGSVFYSNVVQYFKLTNLKNLFYKKSFLNSNADNYNSMYEEVSKLIDPLAKAREIKEIYEKHPETDPNFFELLAVIFTVNNDEFAANIDLLRTIKDVEVIRAVQNDIESNESPLLGLVRSAFEVTRQYPTILVDSDKFAIATASGVGLYLSQERKLKDEKDVRFDNENEFKTLCNYNDEIISSLAIRNPIFDGLANNLAIVIADAKEVYDRTKNRSLTPGEEPQQR